MLPVVEAVAGLTTRRTSTKATMEVNTAAVNTTVPTQISTRVAPKEKGCVKGRAKAEVKVRG